MSVERTRLKVVLCWHMHQPEYRDPSSGEYRLPWTYLHAIKDYVDMAAHLEQVPKARAVVNFVPILLEQIEDYAHEISAHLKSGGAIRDPLLSTLASPLLPEDAGQRRALINACLRANAKRLIHRFAPYQKLAEFAAYVQNNPHAVSYVADQYIVDLVTWYHLAWLGETVRRGDERVQQLITKGQHFTLHDRRQLLQVIGELLGGVLGRYRRLAERGQVELAMTPYAHPIAPLLLDIKSAREAMPQVALPSLDAYPGGEERVRWHVRHGIEVFERHFGFKPKGCWPAEGGISARTVEIFQEYGFAWAASGGNVLNNSLSHAREKDTCEPWHQPYRLPGGNTVCFFRDDGLADLIGFTYSDWHADDAVANLVHHLEHIARQCKPFAHSVVSIILDGENAWEYYPENGYYFLSALYQKLSNHPQIELTTFSDYLKRYPGATELPRMLAGSWVYGTFSTWIGDRDKNRGWDMLGDAKKVFDRIMGKGQLTAEQSAEAERQLAICEGSDWFWWFGDYNPADSVSDFERLFRLHLVRLYQLLGEEPPDYLSQSFTHGSGAPAMGGTMRPGQASA